jgi:putative drug exporter of the RND superfamily
MWQALPDRQAQAVRRPHDLELTMLSKALTRLGGTSARRPWRVIGAWLLLTVLAVVAAGAFGGKLEDSFRVPGLDSQRAADLMTAAGSDQVGMTAQAVLTPLKPDDAGSLAATAPAGAGSAKEALEAFEAELNELPRVLSTTRVVSPDGWIAAIRIQYPDQAQLSVADLDNLKALGERAAQNSPLRIELGGDLFFAFQAAESSVAELVGILAAAAILFLAFGSLIAAALPIGMAVFGLAVGISTITLLAGVTEVPTFAPVLGSMVGLGVGIDYALFVLTRHREYLARGLPVEASVARAVATAGQPVVFAGGIVVVSILGMAVAGVPFMTAGAVAISLIVLIMVIASVTLLPAMLGLAGHRINSRRARRRDAIDQHTGEGWQRWIGHVNRHPIVYATAATAVLLAAAAPVLSLRVGIPDDGALPPSRTERQAYDLVAQGFGPGTNGPIVVAVDLGQGGTSPVQRLAEAIEADGGIADVAAPSVNEAAGVATMLVYPTTGPQDEATLETIERLRATVIPQVLDDAPAGERAQAYVGGASANFADVGQRVNDRLPSFIAAVLAMSFLLLMLVFRSVLVPLKAVLLNLLSIGASFGVMVMIFQWGWGAGLIGLEQSVPIVSFIPMFMFAILFGLSMDYEVFLLSRVREVYARTGNNNTAIVRGISSTARVITSAAAIMICVFASFVLGPDPATKMFGIGLATAILVDATLVRMVLVPATMTLLGNANWWLPGWLDRVLPHVDGERYDDQGGDDLPELKVPVTV